MAGAKITVSGETAWFSTTGTLTSGDEYEKAYPFYLEQMRDLLMDEKKSLDDRLTDATHFGVNRLRDRMRGKGAKWPFVITAVLVKTRWEVGLSYHPLVVSGRVNELPKRENGQPHADRFSIPDILLCR